MVWSIFVFHQWQFLLLVITKIINKKYGVIKMPERNKAQQQQMLGTMVTTPPPFAVTY